MPTARTKPCKGMMGLVEEGQEVMAEGEEKEDALADLALIGAAQRVEHYPSVRLHHCQEPRPAGAAQRGRRLAFEVAALEENADQLLYQIARSLMSVATMPADVCRQHP